MSTETQPTTPPTPDPAQPTQAADMVRQPLTSRRCSFSQLRPCEDDARHPGSPANASSLYALGHTVEGTVALLGRLASAVDEMQTSQRATLEQAQRAQEHQAALLQQQKVLTAATLRSELRTYNHMSSQWKPLPLPNGEPFPVGVPFPRNIRALRDTMTREEICLLAQLYEIEVDDGDKRLRDHLAIFLAGLRA
ncbi:hypothetical protein ONZ51_g8129 [Trametes cubensis]|uniref:Uncharacterized protein n=1 Tax=Trametes cubensis TaxID=1111947 RepID=A0AAD7X9J3_9APHY|nr:hypothetical protein ONZ51_g8129 [Trametes cubensis]